MSEYRDRGIVKWAPFDALTGHSAMLENMIYNLSKKQKNSLSDDEYEDINRIVIEAFDSKKIVSIDYFVEGYTYTTFGIIKKLNSVKKELKLDTDETILFDSIIGIRME